MHYRKIQATQLFTGTTLLDPGQVLVLDDQDTVSAIVPESEAGLDIQRVNGILTPGFVNCHCHLELSHMKGLIPEATGLVDFVFKVVTERHHPDEAIADAIRAAEETMRAGGIVAVGDICNNASTAAQKQEHRLAYYNFIETSGWVPAVAEARFARAMELYALFECAHSSLSPHAPYSVSEPLWQLMMPHFAGKTVTIHNQETAFEDSLFLSGEGGFTRMYEMMKMDTSFFTPPGLTSLRYILPRLRDAAQVLLVHNTFTGEEDILFAQKQHSAPNWCLCVNANLYIENALPPIDLLRRHGCRIVVGTDSLASNHSLSMLDELKTITRSFPGIPLAEKLRWATSNGAHALQMEDRLGSFEPGKRPGLVLLQQLDNGDIAPASTATVI